MLKILEANFILAGMVNLSLHTNVRMNTGKQAKNVNENFFFCFSLRLTPWIVIEFMRQLKKLRYFSQFIYIHLTDNLIILSKFKWFLLKRSEAIYGIKPYQTIP